MQLFSKLEPWAKYITGSSQYATLLLSSPYSHKYICALFNDLLNSIDQIKIVFLTVFLLLMKNCCYGPLM